MHFSSSIVAIATMVGLSMALPTTSVEKRQECTCPGAPETPSPAPAPEPSTVYQPDMYTISSNGNYPSGSTFDITLGRMTYRHQIATFKLPETASTCTLMWGVGADRDFTVNNSGLVAVDVVSHVPSDSENILDLVESTVGKGDFTNWPEIAGPHQHIVGGFPCKSEVSFWLRIANGDSGSVKIEQNFENGWYVSYE